MQMGKAMGLYVVGVCETRDIDFVKTGLGADEVVDYTTTNFADLYQDIPFDIVVDPMGIRGAGSMQHEHQNHYLLMSLAYQANQLLKYPKHGFLKSRSRSFTTVLLD